ncbi:MAG: alpha-amylase family glycosyl hydrolase [Candidatus Neomarinimicrobiota bacterium]
MRHYRIILLILLIFNLSFALEVSHCEPPNWWSGMEHDTLKILVYGDDFRDWDAHVRSRSVKLLETIRYDNEHYLGLVLKIKRSGEFDIVFRSAKGEPEIRLAYEIKERNNYKIRGIDARDVVYLLMPDRFADGDKTNNLVEGHKDPIRPEHKWGRRGGDIRGVIDNIDYLDDLGITALWMTPIYENNYINCYHGYTPTDLYAIDPFMGDFDDYHELVDSCHARGIKVIQDHIVNHVSPTHPLAINPPNKDWLNGSLDDYEHCNYRIMDVTDFYGPDAQRRFPMEGWFAAYLADMNMANPDVVDYYIYHTIWWIESMKLDGIREDTYAYSDIEGLSRWGKALKREYPDLFLLAEVMDFDRTRLSFYFSDGVDNGLSSVADFGLSSEIYQLLVEDKPIEKFYREIANDFIYRDPNMMMTFMDNHDMGRFYSAVNADLQKYLNAFTFLFSMRGIPQLYYGNEIGMSGGHDPENRNEFPGGFEYTDHNAFKAETRTERENLIYDQIKAFTTLRKDHPHLYLQKMHHDLKNNIYLLSRETENESLLMAYNPGTKSQDANFSAILKNTVQKIEWIRSPLNGKAKIDLQAKDIIVPPGETVLLLLK